MGWFSKKPKGPTYKSVALTRVHYDGRIEITVQFYDAPSETLVMPPSMYINEIGASAFKNTGKQTSSIWHVLGIMPTVERHIVNLAYKKMSMVYHPDKGGSSSAFLTLVEARDAALKKCIR